VPGSERCVQRPLEASRASGGRGAKSSPPDPLADEFEEPSSNSWAFLRNDESIVPDVEPVTNNEIESGEQDQKKMVRRFPSVSAGFVPSSRTMTRTI
jgi:hypothetical protein